MPSSANLRWFENQKARLGADAYYEALATYGVGKADDLNDCDLKTISQIARALIARKTLTAMDRRSGGAIEDASEGPYPG